MGVDISREKTAFFDLPLDFVINRPIFFVPLESRECDLSEARER